MSWAAAGGGCVVCDTSPQLGGSLDAQNNTILNVGNAGNDWTSSAFTHVGTMAVGADPHDPNGDDVLNIGPTANATWQFKPRNTQDVSGSATTIGVDSAGGYGTGLALIFGAGVCGSNRWFDMVVASSASDTTHVVHTQNLDGSPGPRTYSFSGNNFKVLVGCGTDHNVNTLWIQSGNPA